MWRVKLPGPAMVVAVGALVVASTGSAIAAKRYLLTSTKQISPSVLKQLRGQTGKQGPRGAQGAVGASGASGAGGAGGAPGPVGPSTAIESLAAAKGGPGGFAAGTTNHTVVTISGLAPGVYFLQGQATLQLVTLAATGVGACTLNAGGDASSVFVSDMVSGLLNADTLNPELVHTFADTGAATIDCRVSSSSAWGTLGARIVAIKLGSSVQQDGN
jgi:hypothetical protein